MTSWRTTPLSHTRTDEGSGSSSTHRARLALATSSRIPRRWRALLCVSDRGGWKQYRQRARTAGEGSTHARRASNHSSASLRPRPWQLGVPRAGDPVYFSKIRPIKSEVVIEYFRNGSEAIDREKSVAVNGTRALDVWHVAVLASCLVFHTHLARKLRLPTVSPCLNTFQQQLIMPSNNPLSGSFP